MTDTATPRLRLSRETAHKLALVLLVDAARLWADHIQGTSAVATHHARAIHNAADLIELIHELELTNPEY